MMNWEGVLISKRIKAVQKKVSEENNKTALLVFPHDFTEPKSGIHKYMYEIVKALNDIGYTVDQFGMRNFESPWKEGRPSREGIIRELFLFDMRNVKRCQKLGRWIGLPCIVYTIFHYGIKSAVIARKLLNFRRSTEIPQFVDYEMAHKFSEISGKYDYIIYGYAYWWILEKFKSPGAISVLSQSDLLSSQRLDRGDVKNTFSYFSSECRCIDDFQVVLSISEEELYLFRQLARRPQYYYLPVCIPVSVKEGLVKDIDVIYVAYNNPHNAKALSWIIDSLYDVVEVKSWRVFVIGKISESVDKKKYPLIHTVDYADDLEEYYRRAKVAIVPMLSGSGMKIKVIEALSYGLPVVTTDWGVVGMLNKRDNGCVVVDTPNQFVSAIERLLSDSDFYMEKAKEALTHAKTYHSKETFHETLRKVFK